MKLIIDIDKKRYEEIKRIAKAQLELTDKTEAQIIANGTPYEERPHGDLIKMSDRFGVYFACNKCGYDRMKSDNMNFCPNCGVDFQKGGAE